MQTKDYKVDKQHTAHVDHNREEEILSELEGQRNFTKNSWKYWLISIVAFSWSTFQLYIAYVPINSTFERSIHLAFAMLLAFLIYPLFKTKKLKQNIQIYDYILAIIGAIGVLYIFVNYADLSQRAGAYLTIDIVVAIVSTIFILEASRRVLGPALLIIAVIFLLYDYFGQYMPDLIAHKGASIHKLAGHMFLTTEGIFGVPLGVSAGFVFLFVLFGSLLERAGAGEYFINLAYALLGKYRGGPAKASVVASGLTGVISGSSTANVVTTGTFTIPLMKKVGFPGYKAASVEVAASTNGQLMPPIMGAAAFIIAEFLGMAYTDVIITAAIPAIVSYFALFYIIHLESLKMGLKGEESSKLPPKMKTFLSGLHYLIPVFYLMYILIILRESARNAGFSAIMLMLFIMVIQYPLFALIKKEKITKDTLLRGFNDIFHGMVNGARNMVPIALATAVAGIVVGSVTLTGIGQVLIEVIEEISGGSIILILLLTAFVSLILGMGLPTTANYIVMASLTAPVILTLAFDNGFLIPAIAAHLFVFYFGILADDTPPVGIAAYAGAGIAKSDPIRTGVQGFIYDMRTAILPFMFFFNNELLLIKDVNPNNPNDPAGWVWITNPLEITIIFSTAVIGMFAFASATQGYFITKTNLVERFFFLVAVPFMFLPKIVTNLLHLPTHYLSYVLGIAIIFLIYLVQRRRD